MLFNRTSADTRVLPRPSESLTGFSPAREPRTAPPIPSAPAPAGGPRFEYPAAILPGNKLGALGGGRDFKMGHQKGDVERLRRSWEPSRSCGEDSSAQFCGRLPWGNSGIRTRRTIHWEAWSSEVPFSPFHVCRHVTTCSGKSHLPRGQKEQQICLALFFFSVFHAWVYKQ